MPALLKAAIVDPSPLTLLGEMEVLVCAGINVIGTATDISYLPHLLSQHECKLAVIAAPASMHAASDTVEHIHALTTACPSLAIVALTDNPRRELIQALIGAGVRAIVDKAAPWSELPAAIYAMAAGRSYHGRCVGQRLDAYMPLIAT